MPLPDERTLWPPAGSYYTSLRSSELRWRPPAPIDKTVRQFEPFNTYSQRTLRVPIVADLATASADLIFGEEPIITAEDSGTNARLQEILDEADVGTSLVEAAEWSAALGGVFLRTAWDKDAASVPLVAPVSPLAAAYAVFSYGRLREVTLWDRLVDVGESQTDRWQWTHLEHHSPGQVEHALYVAAQDARTLGKRVPLDRHPTTASLRDVVEFEGDTMLVTYVPNVRPGQHGAYGRPDVQFTDLLDALDDVLTSWMRDIRLGQARIVVPNAFLQRLGRGGGAIFDVDREVFTGLEMAVQSKNSTSQTIDFVQPAIRAADHEQSFLRVMHTIIQSAGYSPESFGQRATGVAETASSLRLRERRTLRTGARKSRYWSAGLRDVAQALLAADNAAFGGRHRLDVPLVIEFGDPMESAPLELAQTASMLLAAQAASIAERVRTVHPEWDEATVQAEVAAITREMGAGPTLDLGDEQPGI